MLVDVLNEAAQEPVTDGVLLYRFTRDGGAAQSSGSPLANHVVSRQLELFFCYSGSVTLVRENGVSIRINPNESILLSDLPDLVSISIQQPPVGFCLLIDPEICTVFSSIYRALSCTSWSYEQVQSFLQEHGGYLEIKHSSWNQSMFSVLYSLPDSEQASYCVLKAAELFYLILSRRTLSNHIAHQTAMPIHFIKLLHSIAAYIECHLDEKLTISSLCQQFNISPTTLKNKFREFYGQPIHSWILYRRILQAATLLRSTNLPVLQVAQSVGYESASQFNVVFRRIYGISPNLYRKCPIPKKID